MPNGEQVDGKPNAQSVAAGFTESADQYEGALRYNHEGVQRLIADIPDGRYESVLDVGCGTGWSALAFVARFAPQRVIGIDPSGGMLDVFRGHVESMPDLDVQLVETDVMNMPELEGGVDAVICTMALHWFPDKQGAVAEMARRLRPGGVLAILAGGRGVEQEYHRILLDIDPPVPASWPATYDHAPTSERQMLGFLRAAGLDPIDVWIEQRLRTTPVDQFMERMRIVAGHLNEGLEPDELEAHRARVHAAVAAASGPDGFEYHFSKLFTLARKPG